MKPPASRPTARVRGGRRAQADEVDAGRAGRIAKVVVFLGRNVDDDEAIDAGSRRVSQEALDAVAENRIEIAHQENRRGRVAGAEFRHHVERGAHSLAALERPQAGHLHRSAVGHGVRERQTQFDDIGAGCGQPVEYRLRGRPVGIAAAI